MSEQDTSLPSNGRHRGTGSRVVAALIVVLMIAGAGWWWIHVSSNVHSAPAQERDTQKAAEQLQSDQPTVEDADGVTIALSKPVSKPADSSRRRLDNQRKPFIVDQATPTADAINILLPLAEAGRTDAMNELALRLVRCSRYVGSNEDTIRRNALRNFYSRHGHEPATDDELGMVAEWIDSAAPMLDHCKGIDPALMETRIEWMERAARGGDISALLYYGYNALNDMRGREDILIHFDEVARRRRLAGSFLQTALDRGACVAFVTLSAAYSGRQGPYDWMVKGDAYLSLVYAEAAARAGVITVVDPEALVAVVDPARQAAAAAQGAALAGRHCAMPK